VVNEQRNKYIAEAQINLNASVDNYMDFQVSPECERILKLSGKYLDVDMEFTKQVDALLKRE
jgi:hypothetical protein